MDTTTNKKTVVITMFATSHPMIHENVINTFQKGDMFCLLLFNEITNENIVYRYPMKNVFMVREDSKNSVN